MNREEATKRIVELRAAGAKWDQVASTIATEGYHKPDGKWFSTNHLMTLGKAKRAPAQAKAAVKAKNPTALTGIGALVGLILKSDLSDSAKVAALTKLL